MGSRPLCLAFVLCGACGDVKGNAIDAAIDTPPCSGNTIDGCGPSCGVCTTQNDRQVATCDGTACGVACVAAMCSDNSCSRALWNFESGMVDGLTPRTPAGLQLAVRNFNGAQALAIDVPSLPPEVSFRIPICLSGTIDQQTRTFSFRVFFQGPTSTGDQYVVQASVPNPQTGAYLAQRGVAANVWFAYSAPFSLSQFSATTTEVTIQANTYGGPFNGTIWFDDIRID